MKKVTEILSSKIVKDAIGYTICGTLCALIGYRFGHHYGELSTSKEFNWINGTLKKYKDESEE